MNAKVVFEFSDAPRHVAHAMTFTLDESGARLAALDDLGADLVVALAYLDAVEIESGKLTSSQALREGRLKVRGDVNALITFSAWMAAAHEALSQQSE
jgi:ubiquinone biosynthesis protein UbiJ